MSKHKALELAERLEELASRLPMRNAEDDEDLMCASYLRSQHAQLVQMREALESAANGMAELVLEVAYKPATPENIKKVMDAVITQQPDGPFGNVMRALKAADQYLKDNP